MSESPRTRNAAFVEFTPEWILQMVKLAGILPTTAKVMRVVIDQLTGNLLIAVEHPSFPEVREGDLMQRIAPIMRST